MSDSFYSRIAILYEQNRYAEAKSLLEDRLAQYPEEFLGQYYLAAVYLQLGEKDKCRSLTEELLAAQPMSPLVLQLSTLVDLADEKLDAAESKAELMQEYHPEDSMSHLTMARVKLAQRNYDRALENANKALELDAEDIEAYNIKIMVESLLGKPNTDQSIEEALHLNPESAATIANQGLQLIHQGKVNEALDRLKYALSLDPTNEMARYAMQEALRNKFWPYRLFFKYKYAMARLSGKGSWGVIIGVYIGYQILRSIAKNNPSLQPFLTPIIFIIFGLFILTWVMDPLMNLYLLSNSYGQLLLDENDKKMARFTGSSLLLAIVSVAIYFIIKDPTFLNLTMFFFLMMIPLGSFLRPVKEPNRKKLMYFTIGIAAAGLVGILFGITPLAIASLLGIFIYQWVINGIMIKENARVFG